MSLPANPLAIAAITIAYVAFLLAILRNLWRRGEPSARGGQRDPRSLTGIIVQGCAYALVSFGQVKIEFEGITAVMVIEALPMAVLAFASLALFLWASSAMGRNWSIVASTLADHQLVTDGPFAGVRNPIYMAMLSMLLALALALGHPVMLTVALPLFALGTWLRVRIEEKLLRTQFGAAYDAYCARVKRFVPGIF